MLKSVCKSHSKCTMASLFNEMITAGGLMKGIQGNLYHKGKL